MNIAELYLVIPVHSRYLLQAAFAAIRVVKEPTKFVTSASRRGEEGNFKNINNWNGEKSIFEKFPENGFSKTVCSKTFSLILPAIKLV